MASNIITGTTSNQYIDSRIVWSSVANNDTNTSSVTASLQYKRNNTGFTTSGTGTFTITINGTETSTKKSVVFATGWVTAVSATVTVPHDSDGTMSIDISSSGNIPNTTLTETYCSGTATLDTIPQAAKITSAEDIVLGSRCSITWSLPSPDYAYKLKFTIRGWSDTTGTIKGGVDTLTYTGYTIPLDVAKYFKTSKNDLVTITLYTFSDVSASKQIGTETWRTVRAIVPDNAETRPTVSMVLSPIHSISLNDDPSFPYIQGSSKLKATITGEAKYDATISSYSLSVGGEIVTGTSSEIVFSPLHQLGTIEVKGTVTDSRGISNTTEAQTITVVSYNEPMVLPPTGESAIVCARCDENGIVTPSGTYLKVRARRRYSMILVNGVRKNSCTLWCGYKKQSESNYTWNVLLCDANEDTAEVDAVIEANLVDTASYDVQIKAVDALGMEDIQTFTLSTGQVTFNAKEGGKGFAFGKYAEKDNCLEIAGDWDVVGRVYGLGKAMDEIPSGADLNEYTQFGVYSIPTIDIAQTLQNSPCQEAGILIVSSATGDGKTSGSYVDIIQRYIGSDGLIEAKRRIGTDKDGKWGYGTWRFLQYQ